MPTGESLKNVIDRLNPFWKDYIAYLKEKCGNHLIVAHSNSLRAIIKIVEQLSDEEIVSVNIPTGVPLVYEFDDNVNIIHKEYLIDQAKLKEKNVDLTFDDARVAVLVPESDITVSPAVKVLEEVSA